jgi:isocitrate lyase
MLRPALRAAIKARPAPLHIISRPLSLTARMVLPSPSALPAVHPPLNTTLPSDSFQLLSETSKIGAAEDALYDAQVKSVKEWWDTPRFKDIKRPYSAEDVVARRGTLQQVYPSTVMARKLFNLLEEREKEGKPVHTSR